jgi:hypothetical protein
MNFTIDNMSKENEIINIARNFVNMGLFLLLINAKMISMINKSIGSAIDTYIKLLEEELKPVKEKVSVE